MKLDVAQMNVVLYAVKAVAACAVLFGVQQLFPSIQDISWALISTFLVLSPDSKEALPFTIIRVKSNLIASVATVLFLLLAHQPMIAICLAVVVTIFCCYYFNLMAGSRPALAAVVIVALHPVGTHLWSTAVERLIAVAAGCGLGVLLTVVFHRTVSFRTRGPGGVQSE